MQLEFHQLDWRYEALRTRNPQRERRLLGSLGASGQQVPIVVVRANEADRFVVVDGFKRVRVLVRLGHDTVMATCWELSEAEALIVDRLLCGSERASALEQGWLLRDLMDRFGLGAEELARRFDRSVSWVSRRVGLVRDLPAAVQDGVREGRVVPYAAMKYLLPLARANAADCLALLDGLRGERPSSRAMGRLYVAYMAGDVTTRERLVRAPRLFLRADEESRRRPTDASGQLVSDLRGVVSLATRVRRRLETWAEGPLSREIRVQADHLLGRVRSEMERLGRLWPAEETDAGRADEASHSQAADAGTRDAHDRPGAGDQPRCDPRSAPGEHGDGAGGRAALAS